MEIRTGDEVLIKPVKVRSKKIVVVCFYQELMDILANLLQESRIGYCRIDGNVEDNKRGDEISEFRNNPKKQIFLLALTAGGVGINLQVADTVVLVDQWWNPGK